MARLLLICASLALSRAHPAPGANATENVAGSVHRMLAAVSTGSFGQPALTKDDLLEIQDECSWLTDTQCGDLANPSRKQMCTCRVCPWMWKQCLHAGDGNATNELRPSARTMDELVRTPTVEEFTSPEWQRKCVTGFGLPCCQTPQDEELPCGYPHRGTCVPIQAWLAASDRGDICTWPRHFQAAKCLCNERFEGPGCDGCSRGWSGPNCSIPYKRKVMPWHEMNQEQQDRWIASLDGRRRHPEEYWRFRMLHEIHRPMHGRSGGHYPFWKFFIPWHIIFFTEYTEFSRRAAGSPPEWVVPLWNPASPIEQQLWNTMSSEWGCTPGYACQTKLETSTSIQHNRGKGKGSGDSKDGTAPGTSGTNASWSQSLAALGSCCPSEVWRRAIPTQEQLERELFQLPWSRERGVRPDPMLLSIYAANISTTTWPEDPSTTGTADFWAARWFGTPAKSGSVENAKASFTELLNVMHNVIHSYAIQYGPCVTIPSDFTKSEKNKNGRTVTKPSKFVSSARVGHQAEEDDVHCELVNPLHVYYGELFTKYARLKQPVDCSQDRRGTTDGYEPIRNTMAPWKDAASPSMCMRWFYPLRQLHDALCDRV